MERTLRTRLINLILALTWIISIAILVRVSSKYMEFNPKFFKEFIGVLLILLGTVIIPSWRSLGIFGGTAALILCALISSIVSLGTGLMGYLTAILFYVTIWSGCYFYHTNLKKLSRNVSIKIDEISSKKNIRKIEIERHKLLTDALNKKISRYYTLNEFTGNLSSTLKLNELADIIVKGTFKTLGKSETCLLFMIEKGANQLSLISSTTSDFAIKIKSKQGDIFDKWVMKQRQGLLVLDAKKDFRFSFAEAEYNRDFRSIIASPITSDNRVIGILRLDSRKPENYSPDDLRLLNIISNLIAISLQNALLYKETEELAIKDGLTELYVKHYFLEMYEEEYQRAVRANYDLSVLMIDIDYFKAYNDKFGHTAGDIVLRRVGAILNSIVREDDLIARYGGEEFVMALPKISKNEALMIAEKLRGIIESEVFLLRRERTTVTISIGVATFPVDVRGKDDLIREADLHLLKAKRTGRNKVCAA